MEPISKDKIRHRQIELVAACRGEEERAPELYEAIARAFAAARNEVAGQRLEETGYITEVRA